MSSKDFYFTSDWTLFLDRDGVINRRIPGGYVTCWEEFVFLEGVMEAMKILASVFGRIIVVSNQQGIGKGLMTVEQLKAVDARMREEIESAGGWIDVAYYAPHLASDNHPDRKPGTGLGLRARSDFPEIDFARSIMVGDTASDIHFGKNLGMLTVFIGNKEDAGPEPDLIFDSLISFAKSLHR
jgi:histidinol-phosphate phosphatase family protein